ncbi:MAG: SRPBCC domain-containing protein [Burkholderiales bacterium]|nr:SRPBCC domain-containing protein [Burkholderiales bacterium]
MHEIKTQIDIDAPAAVVWSILADFAAYGRWNPLIPGVLGRAGEGRRIEITAAGANGRRQSARPTIVRLRENREMQWVERWRLPGMFSAERRFRIELRSRGVRFHYIEKRGGLWALLSSAGVARLQPGVAAMARALKERAERMVSSHGTVAAASTAVPAV